MNQELEGAAVVSVGGKRPKTDGAQTIPEWWGPANQVAFWDDWNEGRWEPATRAAIEECVRPGSTYVDVGAWIGPTVLWAAPLAGRILAVEPDPVAREFLAKNIAHLDNVEIVAGAIAAETGTVRIVPHAGEGFGSSMTRIDSGAQDATWSVVAGEDVPSFTLPDLFERYGLEDVSLVKMDIEGGEVYVVETVAPFLAERGIAFACSLHANWWFAPFDMNWFSCFSEVRTLEGGADEVLCIP